MKRQILIASIILSLCCGLAFWQVERSAQASSSAAGSQISPASSPMVGDELNPFVSALGAPFGAHKTIGGLAFLAPVAAAPAGITYTVNVTTDTGAGSGTTGDLRYAITQVNAGSGGGDTINIFAEGTITLASTLPMISKSVSITGLGADRLTVSGNNAVGVFQVGDGSFGCPPVAISNLTIANGSRDFGAGVLHNATCGPISLTLNNITFSGNNATVAGGGLYAKGFTVVNNCTFTGNSGGARNAPIVNGGGAIFNEGGSLTVTNSTFFDNRADAVHGLGSSGGAINAFGSALTILNSTITGNEACGFSGGGILFNNIRSLTLRNTIISGNCAYSGTDIGFNGFPGVFDISNNMFGSPVTNVVNGVNGNIIGANLLLGPLGNYGGLTPTIPLLPGSPAIGAGAVGVGIPTTDQRGIGRIGRNDIGAFQSRGFTLAIVSGNNQIVPIGSAFNPLQVSVSGIGLDPVNGGQVMFTPPTSGASAALVEGNLVTIANGTATTGAWANATLGAYNVTANAKGASAAVNFAATNVPNTTTPTFTPAAAISRLEGQPAGAAVFVGTVADGQSPAGSLTVTRIGGTARAIAVTGISNTNGMITAQVSADCDASAGTVRFQVSDGILTSTGDLQVAVIPQRPPTVGIYPDTIVAPGGNTTVTPTTAPSDDGIIFRVNGYDSSTPRGIFTGSFSGDTTTGAMTITGANPPGTYTLGVIIFDNCSGNTQRYFNLIVGTGTPPVVTMNPQNQSVAVGGTVTFTAAATGVLAPTVRWQVSANGGAFSDIPDATSPTLTLSNITAALNLNRYQAVFTNSTGSATAGPALLTVLTPPVVITNPQNQSVAVGGTVTFTAAATGVLAPTVQWQVSANGGTFSDIPGSTDTTLTLSNITAALNLNRYQAVFTNSTASATAGPALLTVISPPVVITNPQNQSVAVGGTATFTALASGLFPGTAPNGLPSGAALLPGESLSSPDHGYRLIYQGDGNLVLYRGDGGVLWVSGTAGQPAGRAEMQADGNFAIYGPSGPAQYNTATNGNPGAFLSLQNDGNLVIYTAGVLPIFSTGTTSAGPSPIPSVQWQVSTDNGATFTDIAGATDTTLSFTVALVDNQKRYRASFSNAAGSVLTTAATLSVNCSTSISTQPQNQTACAGSSATLTVAASGSGTVTYQWRKGGVVINGATAASFTINPVAAGDAGSYDVVVASNCGTVTSSVAQLTVNPATVINTQPANQTITPGQSATFSVAAAGVSLGYQWRKGGVAISGATLASFTIPVVQAANAGNYDVVVTGACGALTSQAATLTLGCGAITLSPSSVGSPTALPAGTAGAAYTQTFTASGGASPYGFAVTGGSLPGGLLLSAAGLLSGTPNVTGAFSFTVTATDLGDANRCTGARNYTLAINSNCPTITVNPANATLPAGQAGTPYNQSFTQTGGAGQASFAISAGSLPGNLTLSTSGVLSGAPTSFGAFNFTVQATDGNGCTGARAYSLTVTPPCPTITVSPSSLNNGTVGTNYNATFTQSGASGAITWSVSAGALPTGLQLNSSTGALTGSPTTANAFSFTIKATDANRCMGTRAYTVIISGSGSGLMFYPLAAPVRLLDTRGLGVSPNACTFNGNQPIAANTSLLQAARGICGIPATAQAITGNVTTVNSGGGYLTLYPSGAVRPTVASINYNPNEIVNNVFTVGLGAADGAFNIYALNTTDTVIDVTGYYAPPGAGGLYFHLLPTPVRLLETRMGQTAGCVLPGMPLPGGADSLQTATTACTGIPAGARAIVGNATTVSPQSGGYLTLYPADAARPLIASSNYSTNQLVNGPFTTGLSPSGQFNVFTLATTDLVIDLVGYYSAEAVDANGAGLLFTPLAHPVRLLETRDVPSFPGCFKPNAPINGGLIYTQMARVTCDGLTIPATALGVVGNATTVAPASAGYLTLWPSAAAQSTQPTVATLNYNGGPMEIVNRHFMVGLGSADGSFKIFSFATTDLVIDLTGYFAP